MHKERLLEMLGSQTTPQRNARDLLLQLDFLEDTLPSMGKMQWQTLYSNVDADNRQLTFWCALLEPDAARSALTRPGWDLLIGDGGLPCFSVSRNETKYERFGGSARPLVRSRSFYGAFPEYFEVDEEFRLYHNLAHDRYRGVLLSFDDSGREIEVVRIAAQEVSARLDYLRQFQAGTGLHLALYFESQRYSQVRLADVPENDRHCTVTSDRAIWARDVADCDWADAKTFSRLLGKVILQPPPPEEAGVWPFSDRSDRDVNFIVGMDSNGDPIESTSSPDQLRDYFGANSDGGCPGRC